MSPHATDFRRPQVKPHTAVPRTWITGLGSAYPPYQLTPEDLEAVAARHHDLSDPGIAKLLLLSQRTGILSRPTVLSPTHPLLFAPTPPSISALQSLYLHHAIPLTTSACLSALSASPFVPEDITHLVGVSCTSPSPCPGIDFHVASALGLGRGVKRTLLSGVGCAGGLAVLRAARDIATAEAARGRRAVVLVFAVEICTPVVRKVLADAERKGDAGVEGALFSDGAGAGMVCNELALEGAYERLGMEVETAMGEAEVKSVGEERGQGWFEILEGDGELIQGSDGEMGLDWEEDGFRTLISKNVPRFAAGAVRPLFERLLLDYARNAPADLVEEDGFDWALHPGGKTILGGVEKEMVLEHDELRASREVYRTRGNSSSPTVLVVLEQLLKDAGGKDHAVTAAFGPGMMIEMMLLRRSGSGDFNSL
ncbi:Hypothetical protein D9617_34g040610 [Elsinoe fawcettii]|nr:Hypothetical protein D9617_34g040610 [Elsinoe fawcettii]